jgi:hypothetical protein
MNQLQSTHVCIDSLDRVRVDNPSIKRVIKNKNNSNRELDLAVIDRGLLSFHRPAVFRGVFDFSFSFRTLLSP